MANWVDALFGLAVAVGKSVVDSKTDGAATDYINNRSERISRDMERLAHKQAHNMSLSPEQREKYQDKYEELKQQREEEQR